MSRESTDVNVSVVMVAFRPHPLFFRQALTSILAQSYQQLEVIVVEDPSCRTCRGEIDALNDVRVRYWLNASRTGLSEQRNQAVRASRAQYVAVCDCDDIAEPTRIERQLAFLEDNPHVGVLGTQIALIDANGAKYGYRRFPLHHEGIVSAMPYIVPLNQSSVMFRKSIVQAAGGYYPTCSGVAEDYDLWSRLAHRGVRFANLADTLVQYRIHPQQMKATQTRATLSAILDIKRQYWASEMALSARIRMGCEQCLVWLPNRLLLYCVMCAEYPSFLISRLSSCMSWHNAPLVSTCMDEERHTLEPCAFHGNVYRRQGASSNVVNV